MRTAILEGLKVGFQQERVANRFPCEDYWLLPLKIQGAFFDCVNVAHHQYRDEAEHAPENDAALPDGVAVHDCPRIHEHDLDIEQDKKHRHHVKLHAEPRLAFTLGDHAAFVRSIFGRRTLSAFSDEYADNQRGGGEEDGYDDLQENRQIFALHPQFPGTSRVRLFHARKMAILLGNRVGQGRRQAFVFLAVLPDGAACHEILQFLISAQAKHFLATAGSVPGPKILVHDVEQLLKFERRTP
jgi:hypothetical protein